MTTSPQPTQAVLNRYGHVLDGLRWVPVCGGFSGAVVWRGDDGDLPVVALKAWPPETTAARLSQVHAWMGRAAHLRFVPSVFPTSTGDTHVAQGDRVWDVTRWLSGSPRQRPNVAEVEAACAAVAELHAAWPPISHGPCPGIRRRLDVLSEWLSQPITAEPRLQIPPSLLPLLNRSTTAVQRHAPTALQLLVPLADAEFPLAPCVRDLRGDHVLFTGNTVTGIVDYGALGIDTPAVDLARLLGDMAGDDDERFAAGLQAYRTAGGNPGMPDTLIRLLDHTGTICSLIGWLVRLLVQRRTDVDHAAVAIRLGDLVARVEGSPRC